MPHFLYPFICWWTLVYSQLVAVVNEAVVDKSAQISLRSRVEIFGYIYPKIGWAGCNIAFYSVWGTGTVLWAEGTGPVIRTEESLSGPETLLSRGSQTCTSVYVWWAPCCKQYQANQNMAAGPGEVAHLLRIGKSRVKHTPKGGTRKGRNRPKSVNLSWAVFTLRKVRGKGERGCWDSDSTWRAVAFYYRFSKVALRCGSPSWVNLCPMKPPRVWGIQVTYFFLWMLL